MTEEEWVACTDLGVLLSFLGDKLDRRWLLACSGLAHLRWSSLDRRTRDAVRWLECHADGRHPGGLNLKQAIAITGTDPAGFDGIPEDDRDALVRRSRAMCQELRITEAEYSSPERRRVASLLRQASHRVAVAVDHWLGHEQEAAAVVLRDIIGNPFRPSPPLPESVRAWNDSTATRMAQGIYEDRAFDRLPILADALLDAGCEDEELIRHCRSEGLHVRGCWAVDLILGKQ
jgi:hypothetical protein